MPLTYEWSDRLLLVQHNLTVDDYVDQVLQAFAQLAAEAGNIAAAGSSRSPSRRGSSATPIASQRWNALLGKVLESDSVWHATGMEIVDAFKRQTPGAA